MHAIIMCAHTFLKCVCMQHVVYWSCSWLVMFQGKIFLHVSDAANHGYAKVMIRTVDSDVLVLAITAVQQLSVDEIWVAFASGKSFRYLPAHEMAHALGPEKCILLYLSCMHSAGVTQCHHSLAVGRKLWNIYSKKSPKHSAP